MLTDKKTGLFLLMVIFFSVVLTSCNNNQLTDKKNSYSKVSGKQNKLPLIGDIQSFDISSDGKKLVVAISKKANKKDSSDLWLMDSDGNNVKRLTSTEFSPIIKNAQNLFPMELKLPAYGRVYAANPKFLPDGKHIAYFEKTVVLTPSVEGYKTFDKPKIIDTDGKSTFENLPYSGSRTHPRHPVFSPDMKHYVYFKEIEVKPYKFAYQIRIGDLDIGRETPLEQLFNLFGTLIQFSWSHDSSKLAISGKDYNDNWEYSNSPIAFLWIYDTNTGKLNK
ncbi:MAG: hypothetical protein MUF15_28420, partial [Acidobacteria bacterium]|nr:hypothetical protein [Acidobacteriota bacterium]